MTSPIPALYYWYMNSNEHSDSAVVYEIRLQGHLSPRWRSWFTGFSIQLTACGHTVLTGLVGDQAALFGVLKKIRDLGLPLLAVNRQPICGGAKQKKEMDE